MNDSISRQAAIDAVTAWQGLAALNRSMYDTKSLQEVLMQLPSAEPERKRGRWETVEGWDGDELYRCSECGTVYTLIDGTPKDNEYFFCPNCGADMREP